jgi:SiaC family regulatory phosphoprotein
MEVINIEGTGRTPKVYFNSQEGVLEMSGRSIPENAVSFYKPIFDWLDEYVLTPHEETQITFNLEYFNTSSSKCILDMLRKLERLPEDGHQAIVRWYYDEGDEDMEESGNDFKSLINLDIELVMK